MHVVNVASVVDVVKNIIVSNPVLLYFILVL